MHHAWTMSYRAPGGANLSLGSILSCLYSNFPKWRPPSFLQSAVIQGIFCLFLQNTKNQTSFLFWIQTDGIILLCFLFVCVGNSLHVFQANTNFTCILTLFSWNTGTIPSSVRTNQHLLWCSWYRLKLRSHRQRLHSIYTLSSTIIKLKNVSL